MLVINDLVKFYQFIHNGFVLHHSKLVELLLKHNLLGEDFFIYNYSRLTTFSSGVLSLETSLRHLSQRHKIMKLISLSTISVFSSCVRLVGINAPPLNYSTHIYLIKIACIFTFLNLKSLSPEILWYPI